MGNLEDKKIGLEQEIEVLKSKKAGIENQYKELIESGRREANQIIRESEDRANKVIASAKAVKKEADDYYNSKKEEIRLSIEEAEKIRSENKDLKTNLLNEKERLIALEKTLNDDAEKKNSIAQAKLDEALRINAGLGDIRNKLNERGNKLNERENVLDARDKSLELTQSAIDRQQATLNSTLSEINKVKQDISIEIENNKALLDENNRAKAEAEKIRIENQSILDNTTKERKEMEAKRLEVAVLLNNLASDKERNSEQEKTLDEKSRWIKLQEREVTEKIKILKELRDKDA